MICPMPPPRWRRWQPMAPPRPRLRSKQLFDAYQSMLKLDEFEVLAYQRMTYQNPYGGRHHRQRYSFNPDAGSRGPLARRFYWNSCRLWMSPNEETMSQHL